MSLEDRTQREFYSEWAQTARKVGLPNFRIEAQISAWIREATCLVEGRCPKCNAPIARYVDGHQQGPSKVPGAWVMYRCSTAPPPGEFRGLACDYMLDVRE